MRKLFKAKRGKPLGLFLLSGIVALQCSFTISTPGAKRVVSLCPDTTAPKPTVILAANTPVRTVHAGGTAATGNAATANNTIKKTKKADKETISFGSPTGADVDMTAGKRKGGEGVRKDGEKERKREGEKEDKKAVVVAG